MAERKINWDKQPRNIGECCLRWSDLGGNIRILQAGEKTETNLASVDLVEDPQKVSKVERDAIDALGDGVRKITNYELRGI